MWTAVRETTKHGNDRFKISELFADERCTQAVLDFLAATDVDHVSGGERGRWQQGLRMGEKTSDSHAWPKKENGWVRRKLGERRGHMPRYATVCSPLCPFLCQDLFGGLSRTRFSTGTSHVT